jgi:hypothetical protein
MDVIQSTTFGDVGEQSLLHNSLAKSLPQPERTESTTPWLSNCGFGGLQKGLLLLPTNDQPGWNGRHSIKDNF